MNIAFFLSAISCSDSVVSVCAGWCLEIFPVAEDGMCIFDKAFCQRFVVVNDLINNELECLRMSDDLMAAPDDLGFVHLLVFGTIGISFFVIFCADHNASKDISA